MVVWQPELIASLTIVALTTESMAADAVLAAVDAFDAVTPHPEGHNLNSMQSLPFYDYFNDFGFFIIIIIIFFVLILCYYYYLLLFLCVFLFNFLNIFFLLSVLLNLYHTTVFALCNDCNGSGYIQRERENKTGSQLLVGVIFFFSCYLILLLLFVPFEFLLIMIIFFFFFFFLDKERFHRYSHTVL